MLLLVSLQTVGIENNKLKASLINDLTSGSSSQSWYYCKVFNSLPNNKILDWSKLKAFADDKIIVAELMISFSDRKNIVGKGENAGHQHFLHFLQCFQKPSFSGSLKVRTVW